MPDAVIFSEFCCASFFFNALLDLMNVMHVEFDLHNTAGVKNLSAKFTQTEGLQLCIEHD